MALDAALRASPSGSVYEERGMLTVGDPGLAVQAVAAPQITGAEQEIPCPRCKHPAGLHQFRGPLAVYCYGCDSVCAMAPEQAMALRDQWGGRNIFAVREP